MILWQSFRLLLGIAYAQDRLSNAGSKRIDSLILFNMLVFQQLFLLGDKELAFLVNDRRSFEKFFSPGEMNSIRDAATFAFLRGTD